MNLANLGMILIIAGILLIIISGLQSGKGKTEAGFVGFIGPFPVGFGTSKNILYLAVGLTLFLIVIFLLSSKAAGIR